MENNNELPMEVEVIQNSQALSSMIRAEVDSQITTAKMFPRDISKFRNDAIEIVTMDESIAESCMYALKQPDGKIISGPSVRMAEIIVSCYGNMKVAGRILSNNGNSIVVEAVCLDLEKNIAVSMPVTRSIRTKKGEQYSAHLQNVTTMAGLAIAYRNSVLKVIPLAITKIIIEAAKRKIAGLPAELPERRAKALQIFIDYYKVGNDRVLKALNKPTIESIDQDDLITLRGYITALREGESTIEDIFPTEKQQDEKQTQATSALKNTSAKVAEQVKGKAKQKDEAKDEPREAEKPKTQYIVTETCVCNDIEGDSMTLLDGDVLESTTTENMFKIYGREAFIMLSEFEGKKVRKVE